MWKSTLAFLSLLPFLAVNLWAQSPTLQVSPEYLLFETRGGASLPPQTFNIYTSAGTAGWSLTLIPYLGGSTWLTVSPMSGTSSTLGTNVQVSVNTSGLTNDIYAAIILVNNATTNEPDTGIVIILFIDPQVPSLRVTPAALQFTGIAGGFATPAQPLAILNDGPGSLPWTATKTLLSGGSADWVNLGASSGTAVGGSTQLSALDVTSILSRLSPGKYSGSIQISSPAASNSPANISVLLNVLPSGTAVLPVVKPSGLILVSGLGGSPISQSIKLSTAAASAVTVTLTPSYVNGSGWLGLSQFNASLQGGLPVTINVTVTPGGLTAGVYQARINLQFIDNSPSQTINVVLVIPASGSGGFSLNSPVAACMATKLLAVDRTVGSSFSSLTAWPTTIETLVVDDCGFFVKSASVTATFSNGDPPLILSSLGNGTYSGTWRPVRVGATTTINVRASLPPLADAQIQLQGKVSDNPGVPAIFSGGIVHSASYDKLSLAPGGIIAIFGKNLAQAGAADAIPLKTTLGGLTLTAAGRDLPLYYTSGGQVNAQLPAELTPNTQVTVIAKMQASPTSDPIAAVPEVINIGPATPGVFTTRQDGTGQGVVLDIMNRVVDSNAPAKEGDVVVIYCTGLGATSPPVPSGQAAPAEPLARVIISPMVTIGGQNATVQFAGMTPGLVGLYQINAVIPPGVTPGSAVSLGVSQNFVPSNKVTIAIR